MTVKKIISGGQTGVDQGALDFALMRNMVCGGWCIKGRKNEKGIIASHYPLEETDTENHMQRTDWNIRDSDGVLILSIYFNMGPGTVFTHQSCIEKQKPVLVLDLKGSWKSHSPILDQFIKQNSIKTLNIAGNKESESPGIYQQTLDFLNDYFFPETSNI